MQFWLFVSRVSHWGRVVPINIIHKNAEPLCVGFVTNERNQKFHGGTLGAPFKKIHKIADS
jgi:hypothetical protein